MDTDPVKTVEVNASRKEQELHVKQIASTEKKIKRLSKQPPETAQKSVGDIKIEDINDLA